MRQSRVAKYLSSRSRLLAPDTCYHLTIKSCHSILGISTSCPGSAGCSKVEIKANLLLWLWKTSLDECADSVRGNQGCSCASERRRGPGSALCHAAVVMLIYTSWWCGPKLYFRVAQTWIRLAVHLGSLSGRFPTFSRWHVLVLAVAGKKNASQKAAHWCLPRLLLMSITFGVLRYSSRGRCLLEILHIRCLVVGSFTLSLERQKGKGVLPEVQTTRFCGQNL